MSTALVPVDHGEVVQRGLDATQLLERWGEGRSPETLRAYTADVRDFARWLGKHLGNPETMSPNVAIATLLDMPPGRANELARAYRSAMLDAKMSPATVNRRLSALRSLVSLANEFGWITWLLSTRNVGSESYRDTRGPELDDVGRLLEAAGQHEDPGKAARDVAIIWLLYGSGLRRGEVAKLDLADFETRGARGARLRVLGKGRLEPVKISLAPAQVRALAAWVAQRGNDAGPLFCRLDRAGKGVGRLTGHGIRHILLEIGEPLGITARPHGLRHAAITAALDETGGNVRFARQYSRHRSIETVLKYDDQREDVAGDSARKVVERVTGK